jgi:mono/diheme cytochrome c family protein
VGQPEGAAFPPPFTAADVARSADVVVNLENPVPADSASLARGQVLYDRNCAPCHGLSGVGAEAPLAEVHPTVAVYNLAGERVRNYTDGYIYGMIRVGRALMPGYGHRIGHFDRWHIVNYVRQLQAGASAPGAQGGGG